MDSLPLSSSSQALLSLAADDSVRRGHHFMGVEHLLSAATAGDATLARAFEQHGVDLDEFLAHLMGRIEPLAHRPWGTDVLVTPRCQEVIDLATRIALRHRKPQVTPMHLIEAVFREGRSVPMRLLQSREVRIAELCESIVPGSVATHDAGLPLLERFGRDLSAQARDGTLMPVIGRDAEIQLVIEVLLRKRKNNPVLIGEAGVGKTAVVEGLASTLSGAEASHPLRESRIIELSVASLVAGTKYRGDFEERMLGVLKEAASDPRVILFFDEIHTLVGAGSSSGETVGASEIVKPALARGDLRCLGATTIAEYRRHIESDAALERRFEPVMIEEPTASQARAIVAGIAPALAAHHGVQILPEALDAAVELTMRYVPHRRLPDKAVDAVDQSGARVRLGRAMSGGNGDSRPRVVDAASIACTVSQWTGIPLERLSGAAAQHLLGLEEELRSRVVGQDHACRAVARAIVTSRSGLADPDRPAGTFLFMGPTGVGKTELAKALARSLFGDERRLVRFDMSEYMEPHSIAKLIGAPPGYVGHEQEGLLVSAVRTHPDCVVLFDEIEKAHPQVFDVFLQILDEGRLTDSHGRRADFRNAVIILTSNLTLREAPAPAPMLGFKPEPTPQSPGRFDLREALATVMRPELVNRIDEILLFSPLDPAALRRIVDRYVQDLERLAARDITIQLDDDVYDFLLERGISPRFGARELRRTIDRHLRQPLAEALMRHGPAAGRVHVRCEGGRIEFVFGSGDRA